jgi:hypothetical protein
VATSEQFGEFDGDPLVGQITVKLPLPSTEKLV